MGKGGQKSETSKQAPTRKTKAAVDRRQNNRMLRQSPSGIARLPPHHVIAVPTAMQNSYNVRSPAVGKQLKQKSSSLSIAQHHLPAFDLFWASFFLRVQLTSLLLISPGLLQAARKSCDKSSCCYSRLYGAVIFRSRTEARNQAGVIA